MCVWRSCLLPAHVELGSSAMQVEGCALSSQSYDAHAAELEVGWLHNPPSDMQEMPCGDHGIDAYTNHTVCPPVTFCRANSPIHCG